MRHSVRLLESPRFRLFLRTAYCFYCHYYYYYSDLVMQVPRPAPIHADTALPNLVTRRQCQQLLFPIHTILIME